ncbi:hypothetical protein BOTBODRAFT_108942 [Botryobasidium botryosum FD-172 SS1]|uniref:Uncharacterized protein n=1 Tax=Botryobasidium botryosum (strain FD-172 SS1) TaxID=930990 RepID=A0A067MI71_BOTB1|nr:hypothetical protein BOTBODRAFT_108942 [Botryobasidium botryosum FD-172 SS1]
MCPACPQPGINYFPDAEHSGPEYIHTLFLAVDGNFRLQLKKKLRDLHDFHLHDGQAYFRNEEEYKHYLSTVKESKQVSHHAMYINAVVTGVVAVYCARHGMFRPDSIVDLEKGEKYINSDYALSGALAGTDDIPHIVVSYDVACQYVKHFRKRFEAQFPDIKDYDRFEFLIPKMHLYAHKDDCHYRYSFNYTKGCGRTDGEAPERAQRACDIHPRNEWRPSS